jgi:hypothetical protein
VPAILNPYKLFKALRELGPRQISLYALYRLGIRTGYLRWMTPIGAIREGWFKPAKIYERQPPVIPNLVFTPPPYEELISSIGNGLPQLLAESNEIVAGKARFFGSSPTSIELNLPFQLKHWIAYETGQEIPDVADIKLVWEQGRFSWAYSLGRAYLLTCDERYSASFWSYFETFSEANPPNLGPHWASAQEVALRLLALVFAGHVFADSSHTSPERSEALWQSVAAHAARIPSTLVYARAQNNNHLLTEALGLYTTGSVLRSHPQSERWRKIGWHWLHHGFQNQIAQDGSYAQHSSNYHRLMLQVALWAGVISSHNKQIFPHASLQRLAAATNWLLELLDPVTGRVPNLGPNDGAYILPLSTCSHHDYRPVLQAAALSFLDQQPFPPGPWDEMASWLKNSAEVTRVDEQPKMKSFSNIALRLPQHESWAYLRIAHFTNRPGHADQMHLDLWWRGRNIAQDAGTYLYNAPPPWDNSLSGTAIHNTISVAGQDQMTRAGRFLWLDWARAHLLSRQRAKDGSWECLIAEHDGYRRFGLIHRRTVTAYREGRWQIKDDLLPLKPTSDIQTQPLHQARLHWLLPDWPWEIEETPDSGLVVLKLNSLKGWHTLRVAQVINVDVDDEPAVHNSPLDVQLVRAGEYLHGSGPVSPVRGWVSPTYAQKTPALSFSLSVESTLPFGLVTEWIIPPIPSETNNDRLQVSSPGKINR